MSSTSVGPNALSPVKQALLAVEEMRSKLADMERSKSEPIAIIGMGCRFPGSSHNPDRLWETLRNGVDTVSEVPAARWDVNAYFDADPEAPGKMYTRWGAFLDDVDQFEPAFFGISPREALSMDPQQRLLLEVTWEALEHAGQAPENLRGTKAGVFVGMMTHDYDHLITLGDYSRIDTYYGSGNGPCSACGRISYVLGTQGPCVAIDTACSSSLVAIHLACQSLRNEECPMAVAGGVNLILAPDLHIYLSRARAMSPTGRCRTFDAAADGYVRGEGCGVVVLKRLSDALADGDQVLATIRGSAVNHDGRSSGFTVPSGSAQQGCISEALKSAKVEPSQISYVEAHGTGTPLGDPIEMHALCAVLGRGRTTEQPLLVGSLKTNIGHLEPASGIAGLIKVVLSMQHEQIPPHLHLNELNPHITVGDTNVVIPRQVTPWPRVDKPRLAGVSSFGLSGTIAHLVVEEAPRIVPRKEETGAAQLFVLSAQSEEALQSLGGRYQSFLASAEGNGIELSDLCHTAGEGRNHHDFRLAFPARSREQVARFLGSFYEAGRAACSETLGSQSQPHPAIVTGRKRPASGKAVFIYSGQGTQWPGMGRGLMHLDPFRLTIEQCEQLLRSHVTWSLTDELFADEAASRLEQTEIAQPALFALQLALTAQWRAWGIEPAAVVGHSIGEVAAAYVAGILSLEDAIAVVCERGRLMQRATRLGRMASIELDETRAAQLIKGYEGRLSLAACNGPTTSVISGEAEALTEATDELSARGVECRMLAGNYAFHSWQMDGFAEELVAALGEVRTRPAQLPIYSTMSGRAAVATSDYEAGYWGRQMCTTVRFKEAVEAALSAGHKTYLEVGPHPVLCAAVRQIARRSASQTTPGSLGGLPAGDGGATAPLVVGSLRRSMDDREQLLSGLCQLYVNGFTPNWKEVTQGGRSVALPTYAWQRQRYWMDTPQDNDHVLTVSAVVGANGQGRHKLLGHHSTLASRLGMHLWETVLDQRQLPYLVDHQIQGAIVLPGTAYLEMALAAAQEIFGEGSKILRDVEFHRALFLPERGARIVQLVLTPGTDSEASFQIYSRSFEAQQQRPWVLHAAGEIILSDDPALDQRLEAAAIQSRCDELQGSDFYRRLEHWGFQYGPTFQGIRKLWQRDGESLAEINAPAKIAAEADAYQFHPALFDACLQVGWSQLLHGETAAADEGRALMPVRIERLQVHRRPGTVLWSHAIRRLQGPESADIFAGDLTLFNNDGEVAVQITGARAQRLDYEPEGDLQNQDEWLYELQWQPRARAEESQRLAARDTSGTWIIFADQQGVGKALASQLEMQGENCVTVFAGQKQEKISDKLFTIRPAQLTEMRQLLDSVITTAEGRCRGVVYLWSLDSQPAEVTTALSLELDQMGSCGSLLHLLRGLADQRWREKPRLWLITQAAQPVALESEELSVAQAPLWGLGRTISGEHADLWGGLIDLDPKALANEAAAELLAELNRPDSEDQIAFREGKRYVARLVRRRAQNVKPVAPQWRADASYLITGGLGDLGLEVARWMVHQGARRLILLGRTALPRRSVWNMVEPGTNLARQVAAVRELERLGASVHHAAVDIADEAQLSSFLECYREEGWPTIRGVVCAAGQFLDKTLVELEADELKSVLRPKVAGSWLLHRLLDGEDLDFFVLFSSASSLLSSPRLGSYAAANAFQDALANHRRRQGQTALSINWGPWADVGMAARAEAGSTRGGLKTIESIKPAQGLEVLGKLLRHDGAQIAVMPINWEVWRTFYSSLSRSPFLSEVAQNDSSVKEHQQQVGGSTRQSILELPLEERSGALESFLRGQIAGVFRFDPSQLPLDISLNSLGLDSLMGVEIKNRIEAHLAVTLPMVALLQGPTVAALTTKVLEQMMIAPLKESVSSNPNGHHRTQAEPIAEDSRLDQARAAQLLTNFDELSDEQVDQLLIELEAEEEVVQ